MFKHDAYADPDVTRQVTADFEINVSGVPILSLLIAYEEVARAAATVAQAWERVESADCADVSGYRQAAENVQAHRDAEEKLYKALMRLALVKGQTPRKSAYKTVE